MTTQTAAKSRSARPLSHRPARKPAADQRRLPARTAGKPGKPVKPAFRLPLPLLALCLLMPITGLLCWLFLALTLRSRR